MPLSEIFLARTLGITGLIVCFLTILPAGAAAASRVAVEQAWTRASAGAGGNSAVFMTLRNDGNEDDRLIGAQTPAAAAAELHGHEMNDGIMRMRPVAAIDLPAGAAVKLAPGGLH